MILIENTQIMGLQPTIRGMRKDGIRGHEYITNGFDQFTLFSLHDLGHGAPPAHVLRGSMYRKHMILIENTQIMGLQPTIRGMRNPMNS